MQQEEAVRLHHLVHDVHETCVVLVADVLDHADDRDLVERREP
jgi:hypothetical protein